ncbi:MAG: putative DNA ligase [Dehalococcoidia bacterium]|nr:MAG: putative DNA ligase [Dehalococcoidia bacterium]
MLFQEFAALLRAIEETPSRLRTVALLAQAFRQLSPEEAPKAALLLTGSVAPPFTGIELGMAEIEAAKALAVAANLPEAEVRARLLQIGDLGALAASIMPPRPATLRVSEVFDTLLHIARDAGPGSQGRKRAALAALLAHAGPDEARVILRSVTGKLRLGVGEATILDALAHAYLGGSAKTPLVERAYFLTSDIAETTSRAQAGEEALRSVRIEVGKPVRMMLAERLPTAAAIVEELGPHAAEYKYDGERVQIHWDGHRFRAYSRRIEDITHQIPDVLEALQPLTTHPFIVEAEAVVFDPASGALQPFQQVLNRRVRRLTTEILAAYPMKAFVFELLHLAGDDLLDLPYRERRARLEAFVTSSERLALSTASLVNDAPALQAFFAEAISQGTEGVVCKALDGRYQPGQRGTSWIKYKGPAGGSLTDTLDLVVVGAWWGRGRRAGAYGSFLMAVYNPEDDRFETITRLGAGLTDQHLREQLPRLLDPLRQPQQPANVVATLRPDVWFVPSIVFEVQAQELTRSPMHTAGAGVLGNHRGLALRFPRFVRYRDDKGPTDATTTGEVLRLFRRGGE